MGGWGAIRTKIIALKEEQKREDKNMNKIIQNEWYEQLVEECKAIITEAVFTSRWALVEGYWNLGKRLREDKNFNTKLLQGLAVDIGVSERTAWYALQTYDKYPELDKIPDGKNITWNKLITQYLPEPQRAKEIPLPKGKYQVIYADPPWEYSNSGISGAAANHYQTMATEDIANMPVPAAENSVLFMWVTNPLLEDALRVLNAWGFSYKTNMVWIKDKAGQGFYVKGQHELLLICTKGSFTPDSSLYVRSVVEAPRQEHSEKPEVFYEIIEKLYPKRNYLELFARNKRKGWTSYGNEL